ncbi:MAG: sigma 54-interacting transcriptional regulator [Deltaproteobacteria bacterium]|nr:sigma 54-interacting transcriptional regulator [Deltaproteobacteria bacterium]
MVVPLEAPARIVLGRADPSSEEPTRVALREETVSARHATLTLSDGAASLEDLGSTNGTFLLDQRLRAGEVVPLAPWSPFRLGDDVVCVLEVYGEVIAPRSLEPLAWIERRLEEACQHPRKPGIGFVVLHVHTQGRVAPDLAASVLALLEASDGAASYPQGGLLVLCPTRSERQGRALAAELSELVLSGGTPVRVGVAVFPRDGTRPEALVEAARRPSRVAPAEPEGGALFRDPAMVALEHRVGKLARAGVGVLFLGESGVGKEVLARRYHSLSDRSQKPFVAFNCAALTDSLAESELFGHVKGGFSGAANARPGLLASAHGGVLFLDEVADLSMLVQAKLLRSLSELRVRPVGADADRPIDVRILAATCRDIDAMVQDKTFRFDLYSRLGQPFSIPPLRARPGDFEPLIAQRLQELSSSLPITEALRRLLLAYHWPGNVRQVRQVLEAAVALAEDDVLDVDNPAFERIRFAVEQSAVPPVATAATEREVIIAALAQARGNQVKAARALAISRQTLDTKMRAFNIPRARDPQR